MDQLHLDFGGDTTPTEPTSEGLSRRVFLRRAVLTTVALCIMLRESGQSADLIDPAETGSAEAELSPLGTVLQRGVEALPAIEAKTEFSLDDLVRFVRETEFAVPTSETMTQSGREILGAGNLDGTKVSFAKAVEAFGWAAYFNRNPGVMDENGEPELLPNTMTDAADMDYANSLFQTYLMLARLPRGIVGQADGINILEDYLFSEVNGDRRIEPGIAGTLTHNTDPTKPNLVSVSMGYASDRYTVIHELMHGSQKRRGFGNFKNFSQFEAVRAQGLAEFDDQVAMLETLMSLRNKIDPTAFDIANELIWHVTAEPDVQLEDAAYTLVTTLSRGLLPESQEPLLAYFRTKQLVALQEFAAATGVDVLAFNEFYRRFGKTHPSTLVELADKGILNQLSHKEAGTLGKDAYYTDTLRPGMHFVDVNADKTRPEILVLSPVEDMTNSGVDPSNITYRMFVDAGDGQHSLDLTEIPPKNVVEPLTGGGGEEPVVINFPEIAEIMNTVAPGVIEGLDYYANSTTSTDGEARQVYMIEIRADTLINRIDRSRIVARIDDDGKVVLAK
jgi:hypothetical protein